MDRRDSTAGAMLWSMIVPISSSTSDRQGRRIGGRMGSEMIPFSDNYRDKSTEYGYQFEFDCERCGNGYSSSFQKSAAGMGGGLLRAAGGLLAGRLGRGASTVEQMADMARGAGRDAALKRAVEEMRPYF